MVLFFFVDSIKKYFEKFGKIQQIKVMKVKPEAVEKQESSNGFKKKDFGFVVFNEESSLGKVLEKGSVHTIKDEKVRIDSD